MRQFRVRWRLGRGARLARLGGGLDCTSADAASGLEVGGVAVHRGLDVASAGLFGVAAVFTVLVSVGFEMIVTSVGLLIKEALSPIARAFFDFGITGELTFESGSSLDTDLITLLVFVAVSGAAAS